MKTWLQEYVRAAGHSETPEQYHVWCGLSVLAAALGRHVSVRLRRELPAAPNLYVLLIGPSGVGKGLAIAHALDVTKSLHLELGLLRGRTSAEGLIVRMGGPPTLFDRERISPRSLVWLVQPELAATAMGKRGHATALARILTDLYDGSEVPIRDMTRTYGEVTVNNPCVNWLAATTTEWLKAVLPAGGMSSGFLARVVTVKAEYSGERVPEVVYPEDRGEILRDLRVQLDRMLALRGEVVLQDSTREFLNEWYAGRPEPKTPSLRPLWLREPLIATKVAVLLALSEPDSQMVVERRHIGLAIAIVQETLRVKEQQALALSGGIVVSLFEKRTSSTMTTTVDDRRN